MMLEKFDEFEKAMSKAGYKIPELIAIKSRALIESINALVF